MARLASAILNSSVSALSLRGFEPLVCFLDVHNFSFFDSSRLPSMQCFLPPIVFFLTSQQKQQQQMWLMVCFGRVIKFDNCARLATLEIS